MCHPCEREGDENGSLVSSSSNDIWATSADVPVRICARLIDSLILGAVDAILGKVIGFGFSWLAVTAGMVFLYFVLMDICYGATIGKLVLGLRVTGPSGKHPTPREALVREAFTVLGAIPFIGPLLALVAWVWIILTARWSVLRQGKHDLLAGGTRVVRRTTRS